MSGCSASTFLQAGPPQFRDDMPRPAAGGTLSSPALVRLEWLGRAVRATLGTGAGRSSAALEFKEGQEAAGSAAKPGGEPMRARDV